MTQEFAIAFFTTEGNAKFTAFSPFSESYSLTAVCTKEVRVTKKAKVTKEAKVASVLTNRLLKYPQGFVALCFSSQKVLQRKQGFCSKFPQIGALTTFNSFGSFFHLPCCVSVRQRQNFSVRRVYR